jgi:uncharacterized protein
MSILIARNLRPVLDAVLADYALPLQGDHGVSHWARVLENGLKLAQETGANIQVVSLFAVLHDSRRINELSDPLHGPRAGQFARMLQGRVFSIEREELKLLVEACEGHTTEKTHPDATIQTCWDADRLDLGRVGIEPEPEWLCTAIARRPEILNWAHGRGSFRFVPGFVQDEWASMVTM